MLSADNIRRAFLMPCDRSPCLGWNPNAAHGCGTYRLPTFGSGSAQADLQYGVPVRVRTGATLSSFAAGRAGLVGGVAARGPGPLGAIRLRKSNRRFNTWSPDRLESCYRVPRFGRVAPSTVLR